MKPAAAMNVDGLAKLEDQFGTVADKAPQHVEAACEDIAGTVAGIARRGVPVRSGRARASVRARGGTVHAGGSTVPYYGWLEFGGNVGRGESVRRPYIRGGRYMFPAFVRARREVQDTMDRAVEAMVEQAGLTYG